MLETSTFVESSDGLEPLKVGLVESELLLVLDKLSEVSKFRFVLSVIPANELLEESSNAVESICT